VPAIDDLLRGIGVPDARRDFFYLADVANAAPRATARNQRLRVVNGARLNWKKPLPAGFSSQDHKGTDTLLSGFAEFMAAGGDAELVLFRKGLHVAETEALARALGIASRIIWRDEMSLRDFYAELARADIVCDQLGESFPGLVALDAMALGIPVIANFQPEIMGRYFPEPVAARQARTRSEVANHLATLAESESARAAAGEAGRQFARTHLSPKANAVKCLRHLGLQ
jgi:glycosyltransferase involved in cell wall biosynthesis